MLRLAALVCLLPLAHALESRGQFLHTAEAEFARGQELLIEDDAIGALKTITRAIRLDPTSANAFLCRGGAWVMIGDYDAGLKDFDEAIRLEPNWAAAHSVRAGTWLKKGEFQRAIKECDEAIRLDPKLAMACYVRALGRIKIRNVRKDFDAAFSSASGDAERTASSSRPSAGELDAAIGDFTAAIRLDPEIGDAYLGRATAWAKKGNLSAAGNDMEEAIRRTNTGCSFGLRVSGEAGRF